MGAVSSYPTDTPDATDYLLGTNSAGDVKRFSVGELPGIDYLTPQDFDPLAGTGLTDATDSNAINAWLDYLGNNRVQHARIDGTYYCTLPLVMLTNNEPEVYTRHIEFNCRLIAAATMDTLLTFNTWRYARATGVLELFGADPSIGTNTHWANRKARTGLDFINCRSTSFDVQMPYVDRFKVDGVAVNSNLSTRNSNFLTVGKIGSHYCGSYWNVSSLGTTSYGQSAAFTAHSQTGGVSSTSQRSVLTVDTLPEANVPTPLDPIGDTQGETRELCYIIYNGHLYTVTEKDSATGTIQVYPWLPVSATSGTVYYVFGHGFYTFGPNAGIITLEGIECQYNGIALGHNSLYGGIARSCSAQHCTIGWTFGGGHEGGSKSNNVFGFYHEATGWDIIQTSTAVCQATLIGPYEFGATGDRFSKSYNIAAAASATDGTLERSHKRFDTLTVIGEGLYTDAGVEAENLVNSTTTVKLGNVGPYAFKGDTKTFKLNATEDSRNRLFGSSHIDIVVVGTGTGGAPSGTITITPDTGWTVNGTTSVAFSSFAGPARIVGYANMATLDWTVGLSNPASGGGGASAWGGITGTLSDQADLQAALDAIDADIAALVAADTSLDTRVDALEAAASPVRTVYTLAANHSNGTTTSTTITDGTKPWSHPVVAGKSYRFQWLGLHQTVATTTGIRLSTLSSDGAVGTHVGNVRASPTNSPTPNGQEGAIFGFATSTSAWPTGTSLLIAGVSPANNPHHNVGEIIFHCTTSGTFDIQFASEVAASAAQMNAGSTLIVEELN